MKVSEGIHTIRATTRVLVGTRPTKQAVPTWLLLARFCLAGLLLGTAFMQPWAWWLGLVAIYLFLVNISLLQSTKQSICGGLVFGFAAQMVTLSWLWGAYPLDWLGISSLQGIGLITVYWLVGSLPYAIAKAALSAALFRLFKSLTVGYRFGLIFAGLWVCGEVLGALLHSIVVLGPGSSIGTAFSFGYVGYLLADHGAVVWMAIVGGVFALSFVYAVVGFLFFYFSTTRKKCRTAVWLLVVFVVAHLLPFTNPYLDESLSVAAIETDFPQVVQLTPEAKKAKRSEVLGLTKQALKGGSQYVVLPEDSSLTKSFVDDAAVFAFMRAFGRPDAVVIDSFGVAGEHEGESHVQAAIYNLADETKYTVHKNLLAPQGEYLPYLAFFMLKTLGFQEQAARYAARVNTFPHPNQQTNLKNNLPGVIFCYEAVDPFGIRRAATDRRFVALVVSHAWFHEPYSLRHQLDQITRVNTLFARTTVYQAANANESKRY